jgi:hypothetical protein
VGTAENVEIAVSTPGVLIEITIGHLGNTSLDSRALPLRHTMREMGW